MSYVQGGQLSQQQQQRWQLQPAAASVKPQQPLQQPQRPVAKATSQQRAAPGAALLHSVAAPTAGGPVKTEMQPAPSSGFEAGMVVWSQLAHFPWWPSQAKSPPPPPPTPPLPPPPTRPQLGDKRRKGEGLNLAHMKSCATHSAVEVSTSKRSDIREER